MVVVYSFKARHSWTALVKPDDFTRLQVLKHPVAQLGRIRITDLFPSSCKQVIRSRWKRKIRQVSAQNSPAPDSPPYTPNAVVTVSTTITTHW